MTASGHSFLPDEMLFYRTNDPWLDHQGDSCGRTLKDRNLPGFPHPVNLEFFLSAVPAAAE